MANIIISTPCDRSLVCHIIQILSRYANEQLWCSRIKFMLDFKVARALAYNDSKFVLYDKLHFYHTVLKLEYLPFFKFNFPNIRINMQKFFLMNYDDKQSYQLIGILTWIIQPCFLEIKKHSFCNTAVSFGHCLHLVLSVLSHISEM